MTYDPTPPGYIGQTSLNNQGVFAISTPVSGRTERLPLNEYMQKLLRQQLKFDLSWIWVGCTILLACLIFIFVLGIWLLIKDSWLAIAVTTVIVGSIAASPYILVRRLAGKDLRGGYFVRYTGEFQVEKRIRQDNSSDEEVYWCLKLPHGSIEIPRYIVTAVEVARAGQIDFAPNTDIVFEIRDAKDQRLFRM